MNDRAGRTGTFASSIDPSESAGRGGLVDAAFAALRLVYPVPARAAGALVVAGAVLGVAGEALLFESNDIAINLALWIGGVAATAVVLSRRVATRLDPERAAWLATGSLFAAGLAWRDAVPLKLLALVVTTVAFAIAAHRSSAAWVRRAGILRDVAAVALGAIHTWLSPVVAIADATRVGADAGIRHSAGWRRAAGIARGLAIAAPLVIVFTALFASADAVFAGLVGRVVQFDVGRVVGRVVVFAILAWISTGYLRGFLSGTALPTGLGRETADRREEPRTTIPGLGATEVATAMAVLDLLFLIFVAVQFRYLFGSDAVVRITPDLTYADYARRGFFELVVSVGLVVPVLLAADWLVGDRRARSAAVVRGLAAAQVVLVLAIAASAFERLRLYHAAYGFTEARFYAMVLLVWLSAMLIWLAATVLRGRRGPFAFGVLTSGVLTVGVLFVIGPDQAIARANLARAAAPDAARRLDARYVSSLSADAVPTLIAALPTLPADGQCVVAHELLRRWPADRHPSIRDWNWSTSRARQLVAARESELKAMACTTGVR